jgi:hypothetical protein
MPLIHIFKGYLLDKGLIMKLKGEDIVDQDSQHTKMTKWLWML